MPVTLQDAIDHLHDVAIVNKKSQSPDRLRVLAEYCVQELGTRGLVGATTEKEIPGAGRPKQWDVAWEYDHKIRLGLSLKSMLKNLPGTVPNRVDDLMGEVANVQLQSPEIVVGYFMIVDVSSDQHSPKHGCTWAELLESRLQQLTGRKAPNWATGTIEGHALTLVDFSAGLRPLAGSSKSNVFFDLIASEVRKRNPGVP